MKTQSAKAKGRRLQQYVVNAILTTFPFLSIRDVKSTSMGATGVDVVLSEAAYRAFPFDIECKNQETNKKLLDMWKQAVNNSETGGNTLLVISANDSPKLAIINLNTLLFLMKKANENKS